MTESPAAAATASHIETFTLVWQGITIDIKWEPEFLCGTGCLKLRSRTPERARLPVSRGSRHIAFPRPEEVEEVGGVEAYVRAMLDEAARKRAWRKYVAAQMQPSLFEP